MNRNADQKTVASFGDEWTQFDQSELPEEESRWLFERYFALFPWSSLPADASGFDMGCGSGRWARWVAPRVGRLHCIDPSSALDVARRNLSSLANVEFHSGGVDDQCLPKGSQDFGYALGVLHHIPDTERALKACVDLLKTGAPFQLYLYYAFDNRSRAFRLVWRASEIVRAIVSRLPPAGKRIVAEAIAVMAYYPLARTAAVIGKLGFPVSWMPLSFYRDKSFYTMRTDARDRFGTPLEQRFTRAEIGRMMVNSGLCDISFSDEEPYWCAVGTKL